MNNKFWKSGDPFVWMTGVALMFSLLMIAGLLWLIAAKGLGFFWPSSIAEIELKNGTVLLGEITAHEKIQSFSKEDKEDAFRTQLKIGNRDLYGLDFKWVDDAEIVSTSFPEYAVVLERREWGNMYGFIKEINEDGKSLCTGNEECWSTLEALIPKYLDIFKQITSIEKGEIGGINRNIENYRLKIRGLEMKGGDRKEEIAGFEAKIKEEEAHYLEKEEDLSSLYKEFNRHKIVMLSVDGREKEMSVGNIVRAFRPNAMNWFQKASLYLSRAWGFVSEDPREANTEGGVFPAIFGTVFMVLIMSIVVLPFGVLAALYLSEYARQGTLVRIVRICVNNLAGVPSIVFGVFAVGFFIYGLGSSIDSFFFSEALPTPTYGTGGILWASLTLALLTVPVVIVATEEGLAAVPQEIRHGSLALGATKFETTWKIVIPSAMPAILTGLILAIARATGRGGPVNDYGRGQACASASY